MSKIRKIVGVIGWRGMVGSVLLQRMREENDFELFDPVFFSTSNVGGEGPEINGKKFILADAFDLNTLSKLDAIITAQGSEYTQKVHTQLRDSGWDGFWIDAASGLRMSDKSVIALDPVNRDVIDAGLEAGIKDFIGSNCTVSPVLLALSGLFKEDLIEWISCMTYQAASGSGAAAMQELIDQMSFISSIAKQDTAQSILELEKSIHKQILGDQIPKENFGTAIAANALPFIDTEMENGQSREEWKGMAETNKILNTTSPIPVDGTCVRIGALRSHSQALTIKLKKNIPIEEIEQKIANAHDWVKIVPNTKEASLRELTPAAVSGSLQVHIGRLRKMNIGEEYINAFSVADQLLWGAAEPLRRVLRIVLGEST